MNHGALLPPSPYGAFTTGIQNNDLTGNDIAMHI